MLSSALLVLVLFDVWYNPLKIDLDPPLYGAVVTRACYEGTQNQATLKFRESGRFDLHATVVFGADRFLVGSYGRAGDTLFTWYEGERHWRLSDTLVLQDGRMMMIRNDSLLPSYFYLGHCKGLN